MDASRSNKLHLRLVARLRRVRRQLRQSALFLVGTLVLAIVWPLLEGYSFWGNTYRTYTWIMLAVLVPACGILIYGIWADLRLLHRIRRDMRDGEIVQVSGPVQDKKTQHLPDQDEYNYYLMLHGEWFAVDARVYDQIEKGQHLDLWVGRHTRTAING